MNSLIAITEKEVGARHEQCVNGRDLHAFLGVGWKFPDWIKSRIQDYGFQEGLDYVVFSEIGKNFQEVFPEIRKNPQGGRPYIEYSLTLNMAKELCMIERNEKGREARKYFIACENRLRDMSRAGNGLEGFESIGQGLMLSGAIQQQGMSLADLAAICWFRQKGLTQKEVCKLIDLNEWKLRTIEGLLREIGVKFQPVNAQSRAAEIWRAFSRLMGFKGRVLPILKGGAL